MKRKAVFISATMDHAIFNGIVHILRRLRIPEETDAEISMYRCCGEYGLFDAFSDELEFIP